MPARIGGPKLLAPVPSLKSDPFRSHKMLPNGWSESLTGRGYVAASSATAASGVIRLGTLPRVERHLVRVWRLCASSGGGGCTRNGRHLISGQRIGVKKNALYRVSGMMSGISWWWFHLLSRKKSCTTTIWAYTD
jgi:hypothetical protein